MPGQARTGWGSRSPPSGVPQPPFLAARQAHTPGALRVPTKFYRGETASSDPRPVLQALSQRAQQPGLWGTRSALFSRHLRCRKALSLMLSMGDKSQLNLLILKEISPEYSLEGLMLKLKVQYSVYLMRRIDSLEKTLMLGKIEGREGATEDEMVGWHHQLSGREPGQTLEFGQGSWLCCSPWNCKELNMTWQLNNKPFNPTHS